MFRVFSGSCLTLDDMETVLRPTLVQRPHVLGPGVDFFTKDGQPVCPQPGAQMLQKVFSGSMLDLNAMNGEAMSDDESSGSPHATSSTSASPTTAMTTVTTATAASTSAFITDVAAPASPHVAEPSSPTLLQQRLHTPQHSVAGVALPARSPLPPPITNTSSLPPQQQQQQQASRTLPVSTILSQLSGEGEHDKARAARSKTQVLVVGDNSYLMSHVVGKLLAAGYTVRAALPERLTAQQQAELYEYAVHVAATAAAATTTTMAASNTTLTMTSNNNASYSGSTSCGNNTGAANATSSSSFASTSSSSSPPAPHHEVATRLSLSEADMTSATVLREAVRGCRYIVHCGCAVTSTRAGKDPVQYHTSAIQALFDAIRLAGKPTVKRVVVTGAASSIFHLRDAEPASGAYDESCWNTFATAESEPAAYAKIVFEKEAWRLRQMLGIELVVLLPSILIGPSYTATTSEAMLVVHALAAAPWYAPFCPNLHWNFVDVRDAAEAYVRALDCVDVRDQRVIVSAACHSLTDLARTIKRLYPHLTPPTRTANTLLTVAVGLTQTYRDSNLRSLWRSLGVRKRLDNRRALHALGLRFTSLDDTLRACVEQMMQAGELPDAQTAAAAAAATRRRWLRGTVLVCTTAATVATALLWHRARARR